MFRTITYEQVESHVPPVQSFDKIRTDEVNLFISAPGYEDRSVAVARTLRERGSIVDFAVLWQYTDHDVANGKSREETRAILEHCGAEVTVATSMEMFASSVTTALHRLSEDARNILVDISSMTGRLVLETVSLLNEQCNAVVFGYAEALEYSPTREDYEHRYDSVESDGNLGLDHGVVEVSSLPRMRGFHDSALQDRVLILPGFSRDRARACVQYVNPALLVSPGSSVQWTVGLPHLPEDQWRAEAMKEVHLLSGDPHQLTTFDYRAVYRYLEELHQKEWLESNLTIAFLGSKLQGLGVGIFATVHTDVRVVVATPEKYSLEDYTRGVREIWAVDFQDWSGLLKALRSVGTVQRAD